MSTDEADDVPSPELKTFPAKGIPLNVNKISEGDTTLPASDFITTARAANEVAITVRGDAKMRAKRILQLSPS